MLSWVYGLDEDQHVYEYNKVTNDFFHVYFANKTGVSCVLDIDNTGVSDVGQILERAFEDYFFKQIKLGTLSPHLPRIWFKCILR